MTAALEHLQLKIGVEGYLLNYKFDKYGCLATNTWSRLLWEKVQMMKLEIKLHYVVLSRRRGQQDRYLMEMFAEDLGVRELVSWRLNWVRKHQEATFLLDIATVGGGKIGCHYVSRGLDKLPQRTDWQTPVGTIFSKRAPHQRGLESLETGIEPNSQQFVGTDASPSWLETTDPLEVEVLAQRGI